MATKNKPTKKTANKPKESSLRKWFSHGSGGHITVIIIISLITIGFLIYAAANGVLEKYYVLIVLLVLTIVTQVLLFFRMRKKSKT
jgi:hypothetical protein